MGVQGRFVTHRQKFRHRYQNWNQVAQRSGADIRIGNKSWCEKWKALKRLCSIGTQCNPDV